MIIEYTIPPERTGADDMSVGQDIPPLRIDDKPGGLTIHRQLRIERTGLTEPDRHDAFHHLLDCGLPFGGVALGGEQGCGCRRRGRRVKAIVRRREVIAATAAAVVDVVDGTVGGRDVAGGEGRGFGLGFGVFGGMADDGDGVELSFRASLTVHLHDDGSKGPWGIYGTG